MVTRYQNYGDLFSDKHYEFEISPDEPDALMPDTVNIGVGILIYISRPASTMERDLNSMQEKRGPEVGS